MSKSWGRGSTRRQRRIRAEVLARDHDRGCRAHRDGWCAAPGVAPHTCTDTQDCVHHTLGKAVTGDDPRHQVAACTTCNLAIGEPGRHDDPPNKAVTRW